METDKQKERKRERANRKVEKAISEMIDIQDMGLGNDTIQRVLDMLNSITFDT